ncbi:MAG TPA: helix-turn-helix transcriptional regulator [Pyrinomonadaceae bacterium]|nr:helix-turn-helix transcriptional regulator [Pyrinomonadaceae bacterium]
MGTQSRPQPQYLATKLLRIRKQFGASQSQMVRLLKIDMSPARVSEYETGRREPNLIVLLRYSEVAGVSINDLVDDDAELVFGKRKPRKRSN